MTSTTGRSTGANDLSQGSVQEVSKKASVTFAEQKSVSKRIGWASQPFQEMLAGLGKAYIYGLKEHMPSTMAIRLLGENGIDWGEITRLDLNTSKDVDILIVSTDKQMIESDMKSKKRIEALSLLAESQNINSKKRDEEILKNAEYTDQEIAEFMDTKTYDDKKSLAKASVGITLILRNKEPELWFGATTAFMQKILDYANDNRTTLKDKYDELLDYALAHKDIVAGNMERKANETANELNQQDAQAGLNKPAESGAVNEGVPGGVSRAMEISKIGQ